MKKHITLWAESDELTPPYGRVEMPTPRKELDRLLAKIENIGECIEATQLTMQRHMERLERIKCEIERLESRVAGSGSQSPADAGGRAIRGRDTNQPSRDDGRLAAIDRQRRRR